MERPVDDADVVVLAGDISRLREAVAWALRFSRPVLYVPGNHECCGGSIDGRLAELRALCQGMQVQVLDCGEAVIGGVRFLGATSWSGSRPSIPTSSSSCSEQPGTSARTGECAHGQRRRAAPFHPRRRSRQLQHGVGRPGADPAHRHQARGGWKHGWERGCSTAARATSRPAGWARPTTTSASASASCGSSRRRQPGGSALVRGARRGARRRAAAAAEHPQEMTSSFPPPRGQEKRQSHISMSGPVVHRTREGPGLKLRAALRAGRRPLPGGRQAVPGAR